MTTTERNYFVDEAGDLTLFNQRGKIIAGTEGCSNYFVLGTALIENPHQVRKQIEELKMSVMSDAYLQKIPSLKKTEVAFHAKDDCAEVKMQFYKLLSTLPVKVYCIVRRKSFLLEYVQKNNQFDPEWRYNQNKIYDACVKRLFKHRLHLSETNNVIFARRGKSDRNQSLTDALNKAAINFEKMTGKQTGSFHNVSSNYPSNDSCLQVIDYFLWAIQRLYEKHEDRYFNFVKGKFRQIIDLDDKRLKDYGVYYDERNELTVDKIKDSLKG